MIDQLLPIEDTGFWLSVRDGDPRAFDLFSRHYSYKPYADGRRRHGYRNRFLIIGPGEKLVLLSGDGRALFGWRRFRDASHQDGVCCTVFRNEGPESAEPLILDAELCAIRRWSDVRRFYTFIDPRKVKGNPPGNVFRRAGWQFAGITKHNKLIILAKTITRAQLSAAVLL